LFLRVVASLREYLAQRFKWVFRDAFGLDNGLIDSHHNTVRVSCKLVTSADRRALRNFHAAPKRQSSYTENPVLLNATTGETYLCRMMPFRLETARFSQHKIKKLQ
jgi:hypothetical protein